MSDRSVLDQLLDQQAEIAKLRHAVRLVEWVNNAHCPLCSKEKLLGHSAGCLIGTVLNGPKG